MKIMVAGGVDDEAQSPEAARQITTFAKCLAKEIIRQGHALYCGNLTKFDALIIEAACDAAKDEEDARRRVISYRPSGREQFTNRGSVFNSKLDRWNTIGRELRYPEPIYHADVAILVAGWEGTHSAANWARLSQTPILPVASFDEAAGEIFDRDRARLAEWFGRPGDNGDLDILNRAIGTMDEQEATSFAAEIVSLAERMLLSRDVFVVMSYKNDPALNEALQCFEEVCREFGFNAERMDRAHQGGTHEITEAISSGIRNCAFVICDITEDRPNVYYELGYARGLGKEVILTAKEGSNPHFDVQGLKRIKWKNFLNLRDQLRTDVKKLSADFGLDRVKT